MASPSRYNCRDLPRGGIGKRAGRAARRLAAALSLYWPLSLAAVSINEPSTGIAVTVVSEGSYNIGFKNPAWQFSGDLNRPAANLRVVSGSDGIGSYQEIVFNYSDGDGREAGIRTYAGRPVVLFTLKYLVAGPNDGRFPELSNYPTGLFRFSYAGIFAGRRFGRLEADSPWVFFDSGANCFILSPASHFVIAATRMGPQDQIRSGIDENIPTLPEDFVQRTILVAEPGINTAFDTWGRALTGLQGKVRPANDADPTLERLGYWTDYGSTYYYKFEPALGYSGTLLAVRDSFLKAGVPLGYVQLDSWFYPKGQDASWSNYAAGIDEYVGAPALFPQGLPTFQSQLAIPLVTHARWIDLNSPYRHQFRMSGNVSTDGLYWDRAARYLVDSGAVTYEQDWLGAQADADFNLVDREAYLDQMARACHDYGITIQYCMALPRHFLQSSKYDNVTTIRVSADRFGRERWDRFLYTSRLASALGLWPFSDVLLSGETDNLLLATLSAGPVAVGDPIGAVNGESLLRAVRRDGVIVKPDAPLVPSDDTFLRDARGAGGPMVAWTYTNFNSARVVYLLAFARGTETSFSFSPASAGLSGRVYLYDYLDGSGDVLSAGATFSGTTGADGWSYYVLVPLSDSGIGFLGDAGHFVPLGKKRIPQLAVQDSVDLSLAFAGGEQARILQGFAVRRPRVTAYIGRVSGLSYDPSTRLFLFTVSPDGNAKAAVHIELLQRHRDVGTDGPANRESHGNR